MNDYIFENEELSTSTTIFYNFELISFLAIVVSTSEQKQPKFVYHIYNTLYSNFETEFHAFQQKIISFSGKVPDDIIRKLHDDTVCF